MAVRNLYTILHEGRCATDGDYLIQPWFGEYRVDILKLGNTRESVAFIGSEPKLKNWLNEKEPKVSEDYWIATACPSNQGWGH